MKKYTIILLLLTTFGLGILNINKANAAMCAPGDLYSSETGQLCPTTTTSYHFTMGARGESVKAFQRILLNAGFSPGKIDGIYGPKTDGAATEYYKKYPPTPVVPPAPCPLSVDANGIISHICPPIPEDTYLQINPESATIPLGSTARFQAMYNNCPVGAMCFVGPRAVRATWSSSDKNIATISYQNTCPAGARCLSLLPDYLTAVVTAVGEGTATITASYTDANNFEMFATAQVTVKSGEAVSTPVISYLSPTSGPVDTQVVIHGSGFAKYNCTPTACTDLYVSPNIIHFGNGVIPNVMSKDGTTLVFSVPSMISPACLFSVPKCYIAQMLTVPGDYGVYVTNTNGTSNTATFTVTKGGSGSIGACELAAPPAGYHWEGIQPYPTCGGYLVPDPGASNLQ